MKKKVLVAGAAAVVGVLALSSGAVAAQHYIITSSSQIKDGSIALRDLTPGARKSLKGQKGAKGETGPRGPQGPGSSVAASPMPGPKGDKGDTGDAVMAGAYYATAFYDAGDTNAGAIATVACKQQSDTAISGGVQVLGIGGTPDEINAANNRNTPVSSSFPGRMDWAANTPKANRLDGWIIQFGGNAGAQSDKAPEKVKVWALCVPGMTVPVVQTYKQSS